MVINHIALYTTRLEELNTFYATYFGGVPNDMYHNPKTGLKTYFLTFDSGARLEIMSRPDNTATPGEHSTGWAHLAFSAGGRQGVDELTRRIAEAGYTVESGPRTTGDGYYESCILDPDGNRVEIVE